jgi:hypothetical protein
MNPLVTGREGVIGRQYGGGIRARDVNRAPVASGGVAIGILSPHGKATGDTAVVGEGKPVTTRLRAAAGFTVMPVWLPVMLPVLVSVALSDCVPAVFLWETGVPSNGFAYSGRGHMASDGRRTWFRFASSLYAVPRTWLDPGGIINWPRLG